MPLNNLAAKVRKSCRMPQESAGSLEDRQEDRELLSPLL
jgi:hypothetical protein